MRTKTVCILTAGKGTRMGKMSINLTKALHPIDSKAILSHIIDNFPEDFEFIIAIGYLKDQVVRYLDFFYPDRDIKFVDVVNYDGPGSGPGHSLYCCKDHLQKPFYFVSCDTLWDNTIDLKDENDWLGVAKVSYEETKYYCNVKLKNKKIVGLKDKELIKDESYQAFVGLCHIKNYKIFWDALLNNRSIIDAEKQISNGLVPLIEGGDVYAKTIEWTDVGDQSKYKKAIQKFENYDYSKTDESLYILRNKVLKFFVNPEISKNRVAKSLLNPKVFPEIRFHKENFYGYEFIKGKTLYEENNPVIFLNFLKWAKNNLWRKLDIEKSSFQECCNRFYREKTIERLELFIEKYPDSNRRLVVNEKPIPALDDLLEQVPWEKLKDGGDPTFIHGDLQFDNIIYDSSTDFFCLIDWRQDFGGVVEYGDLYYDLAKLYGGINLNYDLIKQNLMTYEEKKDSIFYDFANRYQSKNYLNILETFIIENNLDLIKVRLIVALIYLNMSPLHHFPFDKMLFAIGLEKLNTELNL